MIPLRHQVAYSYEFLDINFIKWRQIYARLIFTLLLAWSRVGCPVHIRSRATKRLGIPNEVAGGSAQFHALFAPPQYNKYGESEKRYLLISCMNE